MRVLVVVLVLSLVPMASVTPPIVRAAAIIPDDPPPPHQTVPPLVVTPDPIHPVINLAVTFGTDVAVVGQTIPFTLTVTTVTTATAEDVQITLPVADGAQALPGAGRVSATTGWQWTIGHMDAPHTVVFTGAVQLTRLPAGRVLWVTPHATARDIQPIIMPYGRIAVPQRASAVTPFQVGAATTLHSVDGQVTVGFPAQGFARPLQLRQRLLTDALPDLRARGVTVPTTSPGWKPGLPPFVLDATDLQGTDIHQFSQPLTITVSYTPDQLALLRLQEADLAIHWFNATTQQWVALPTTLDVAAHTASAQVSHFSVYTLTTSKDDISSAYTPSLKAWQVSLQTGGASLSYPITVPPGPNGIHPDLTLNYNSTAIDQNHYLKQAGWVGSGWSLGTSYIARNPGASDNDTYYSLVLNGATSELVRGATDYSTRADSDTTHQKLTLTKVQEVGSDGTSTMPPLLLSYASTGDGKNRMQTVNNSQGGVTTYTYADLSKVYTAADANTLFHNTSYVTTTFEYRKRVLSI